MGPSSTSTFLGQSPRTLAIFSLVASLVAIVSQWLVVGIGVALAGIVMFLLVLIGFVSGMAGLFSGVYFKDGIAVMTSIFGLTLIVAIVKSFVSALTTF